MAGAGSTFRADDGTELFYETWGPEASASSSGESQPVTAQASVAILFFHGVHESADTLTAHRLAKAAADAGMSFYALEHHGHGRSSGTKALVRGWDVLESHALAFVERYAQQHGETGHQRSFFLAGHSMGGAVAARIALRVAERYGGSGMNPRFLGQVLLAPSFTCYYPNAAVRGLLRAVGWLAPWAPLGPPEHPELYDTGSGKNLNYGGMMRVKTAAMFVDACLEVERNWEKRGAGALPFALEPAGAPCLVLHGEGDFAVPVGPGTMQRKLYEGMVGGSPLSKVELLENEDHQMIAAPTKAQEAWESYLDAIVTWVRTVVSDASARSRA